MSAGVVVSLLINILVGSYFIWLYPKSVRKSFRGGPVPPAFTLLSKLLPVVGVVLIVGSVLYVLMTLGRG